jgi:serine/threonine protein kinase
MAGTPLYLAPEISPGGRRRCGADLYSLGVLLYRRPALPVAGATLARIWPPRTAPPFQPARRAAETCPTARPRRQRALSPSPGARFEKRRRDGQA